MGEDEAFEPEGELSPTEQVRRVKSSSLLWFISSRPYVPMADIRRRFGLQTDTGTLLRDEEGPVHIGLPPQAAEVLLDLKRKRKIGLQFDLEHAARIAVGAYPMRVRLAPAVPARSPRSDAVAPPPSMEVPVDDDPMVEMVEDQETATLPMRRARNQRRRRRH